MPNDENAAGTAEQRSVRDVHAEELLGEAWQLDERVRRKTQRYDLDKFELHAEQLLDSPEFKQQFREESLLKAGACAPCIQQDSKLASDEPHKDLVFVTA